MAESIDIPSGITGRKEKYEVLFPQLQALINGEPDFIANLANIMAALKYGMNFFWVGIYFVKDAEGDHSGELVLGPFQGPVACVHIGYGKGVCGACWQKGETIVVGNVEEFPGHIACNPESKSEIVVPVFKDGLVKAVLDIDSSRLSDFDDTDAFWLKKISNLIGNLAWK